MSTDIDPRFRMVGPLQGIDPAGQASPYSEAAAEVRQRQAAGLPPAGSAVQITTAAPASEPLLPVNVARAYASREITRLRGQAEAIERELSRGPFGASGMQDLFLVEQQRAARAGLEEIRAEIARLDGMTDQEAQLWAANERPRTARGN